MTPRTFVFSSFIGAALVFFALTTPAAADWHDIDWFDDAAGYSQALEKAEQSGQRVLVYFYTDWCPYCRQLNNELLAAAEVQTALDDMLAVRVDAEKGPDERSLAAHYRVRGYPALFVFSTNARSGYPGGEFQPIRRTVSEGSGVRLKTPREFAATLEAASR